MTDRATAALLAERLGASCAEAMLDWGEAVNKATAAEGTPQHDPLQKHALFLGKRTLGLACAIAEKMRPR